VAQVKEVREAVGPDVDVMIDVHGPPWFTTQDAIRVGQGLEPYDILFYEDPVPPENVDALARVAKKVNVPIAVGDRHATIYGFREVIERGIADVIQPDMGRAGGLMQVKKVCGMAEAHYVTVAPHDGSNGPIAEAAAVHLLATIPNFLILEHVAHDVPWRYEVVTPMEVKDGHIEAPKGPGLGVDLDERVAAEHPSRGNVTPPNEETLQATYYQTRARRGRLFRV
jgi:galactonate dehydratase